MIENSLKSLIGDEMRRALTSGQVTITDCNPQGCGRQDCPLWGQDRGDQLPLEDRKPQGATIPCNDETRDRVVDMLKNFTRAYQQKGGRMRKLRDKPIKQVRKAIKTTKRKHRRRKRKR